MSDLTVYAYYKIPADNRNLLLLAVKNLDQTIKAHYPNLKIQHQKKSFIDVASKETWMETYTGVAEAELEKFTAHLSELAEKHGLPSERKYEIFIAL